MIDIATSTTYRLRVFCLRRRDLCLDYYYGSNTTTYRRRVFCFRLRSFCFTTYRRRGFCFSTYHYIQATGFLFYYIGTQKNFGHHLLLHTGYGVSVSLHTLHTGYGVSVFTTQGLRKISVTTFYYIQATGFLFHYIPLHTGYGVSVFTTQGLRKIFGVRKKTKFENFLGLRKILDVRKKTKCQKILGLRKFSFAKLTRTRQARTRQTRTEKKFQLLSFLKLTRTRQARTENFQTSQNVFVPSSS